MTLFEAALQSLDFCVERWRDSIVWHPLWSVSALVALLSPDDGAECETHVHSQGNDPLSFEEFYRKWFFDVCRWARAMGGLNADVEDIAQDVFMIVRRKYDEFDGAYPKAWLYRITRRRVNDYRRRAWLRQAVRPTFEFFAQIEDPRAGPEEVLGTRQNEQQLACILEKMSLVRRTAFVLYEFEGYSGEEIAELEGVPAKTVHSRLGRARQDFIKYAGELYRAEWGDA